ncbi:MAG: transposase [Saprospiraceae bacterium]|nr:transposase [Saprospiraceae bacterium]
MTIKPHLSSFTNLVPGQLTVQEQSSVLNALEQLFSLVAEQSEVIQSLRDEINRLKGEDGKPTISGKNQKAIVVTPRNVSSESARKTFGKPRKNKAIKFDSTRPVDEIQKIDFDDKSALPTDVVFKGYAKSHYQSLEIRAKLIEVQRAIYYSATENKTYTADLPSEYMMGSDYTQELKGHISLFKFSLGLSIPKIGDFLRMHGIAISDGSVSNILLENGEALKSEQLAIHQAGIELGLYETTDTTASRFNGVNYNTHVFGNEAYTAYFTKPHKDRQTIVDLIRLDQPRTYLLNEDTFKLYEYLKIPAKITKPLLPLVAIIGEKHLDQATFMAQIKESLKALNEQDYLKHEQKLLEGAYLSAYRAQTPLSILLCDDAPQYKLVALLIATCWVHAGRHFKKLNPQIIYHQQLLEDFSNRFWAFYQKLKKYKDKPDTKTALELDKEFDTLFDAKTGYEELDDRIQKTKDNKAELLVVLKHPYVPLHNNDSELAVRKEVRHRDISFQTRTQKGTQAKDVFFTIIQTAKKLGVNAYHYIMDRLNKKCSMPPLHILMQQKFCAV